MPEERDRVRQPSRETIASRLSSARDRNFVGRSAEQELWASALVAETPRFAVLWISGPGGIGKSSLLRRFARLSEAADVKPIMLDARRLLSSPDHCLDALRSALGLADDRDPLAALQTGPRSALFFDTAEALGPLENWLRDELIPQLPAKSLVVIAGRAPPEPAWSNDAGWAELLRVVALRNLSPSESRALLSARGVPEEELERLLAVTHGHPLALSLVAEVASRGGHYASPVQSPDVVRCLLERFSHDAPDEAHRQALYAAAHSRVTDEATLRAAVGTEDAAPLYDWLRSLSFVEQGPEGLHLHDLAAEALDGELRSRDPARHVELHARLRRPLSERLRKSTGLEQVRVATDMAWMHRFSPVMGPLVNWPEARGHYRAAAREDDRRDILDATEKFEGSAAASLTEYWFDRRRDAFVVIRGAHGGIGYILSLLADATDEEASKADPRLSAAFAHARAAGPLREGDLVLVGTWLSYATHIAPSAMVAHISVQSLVHFLGTPRLAWSFYPIPALLDMWGPFMAYIDHTPGPAADIGTARYQLFGHDWRKMPPDAFWDFMAERELHGGMTLPEAPAPEPPLLVLSQEEFGDSVRKTLRDVSRTEALSQSLLARCRVVIECPYAREGKDPVRTALETAAESLVASAKDEKLYSVVKATFFSPAPTQEAAAERLGLPFSTYRRHLGNAVERIVEFLWQRELHGWHP